MGSGADNMVDTYWGCTGCNEVFPHRPTAHLCPGRPTKADERKAEPLCEGLLDYFPNACSAVARLSKKANDKHNPGEPMHWAREKSADHADCLLRHQRDRGAVDPETGELHEVAVAWRALAQLEEALIAKGAKPGRNAR